MADENPPWRSLRIMDLPYETLRRAADILDVPALHNWRDILALMPEYSPIDAQLLARAASQDCGSPAMEMFKDMSGRGRSAWELHQLAQKSRLQAVCDVILQGVKSMGMEVEDMRTPYDQSHKPESAPPSRPQHRRKLEPSVPNPPTSPSAVVEAILRYQHHDRRTSGTDAKPVAYDVLEKETRSFDRHPLAAGGHWLGKGGFAEVYYCKLAFGGQEEREVAVKVFRNKNDTDTRKQFEAELQVLVILQHPHLLPLLGYSCNGQQLCLVYPFMPNGSLDHQLASSALTYSARLQVTRDVATALQYLHHDCGSILVHRDVKSANVLLGKGWHAKLADFGVARALVSGSKSASTETIVGTLVYMAPEYCNGLISPAADIYSLGVIMLELLFGCTAQGLPSTDTDLISYVEENEDPTDKYHSCWQQSQLSRGRELQALAERCIEQGMKRRPLAQQVSSELDRMKSN